ncbi:3-oxo-5-alpha-steroid 4-dehydrogenase 1 isoform X2 [Anabas testudineus]|uniref:3-oxo-5-alpha-steroid 4-dehydrogenase 1 isoform X2 n=1 Tax=Anabas testudineus TaxID=64144 RepID=UPI000E45A295|nr:3-oxo-5-alpha-steroid 4-dehydrogenase 1 isoform X2 [Anabas testudineus]
MEALLSVLFSSEEEELFILDCMAYFMVLMAVCTFFTLLFENVPYGRYTTSKYGFPVNSRSLIYPFLIRGGKPTPFASFALAFVFCIYNGYMQIRYLSHYAEYPAYWITHPCFIIGSALWLVGWLMNVHSDHILRNLRKPGETGYKIPTGGMFEYVSGANFLGEITEWAGFALAGHSVHSSAFAIFTTVVLASRAVAHHKWYLTKFENYPKSRKALIPFLF